VKKGVEVIKDTERAKVLVDPMRREILRLLAERPMTENGLAEALGLSDPSVGHHLKILARSGLVRIARKEVEQHGIVQKFYATNSLVYFIDDHGMPLEIVRYFMPVHLERARAMIAALSALNGEFGEVRAEDLEEFARILNSAIVKVAPRYSKQWKGDSEEVANRIYRDALIHLLEKPDVLPEKLRTLFFRARKAR
jgi:DNA-binding transcriptional ArsR family regulator